MSKVCLWPKKGKKINYIYQRAVRQITYITIINGSFTGFNKDLNGYILKILSAIGYVIELTIQLDSLHTLLDTTGTVQCSYA